MRRVVFGLGLVLFSSLLCSAAQQPAPESHIKAAFLLKFGNFVEWPAVPADAPFTVCLSSAHPFGDVVSSLARDSRIRGRRVTVRPIGPGDKTTRCEVAYIAPADHEQLEGLRHRPVLTVGDAPDFCRRGGIINFRTERGRVRFEIELGHARRVGLSIDSQLLRLASAVHGGGR